MSKNFNKSELPEKHLNVILTSLSSVLGTTTLKQLGLVMQALIVMTGRVTMLGISRWCEEGGSYRTVQRLFNTSILWHELQWCLIRHHLHDEEDVYLLAGDEVVVSKSGKQSHGLDRFFSSLQGRPIKSLCFFSLSLISVKRRQSYPLLAKQVIRSKEEADSETKATKQKQVKQSRNKTAKKTTKETTKEAAKKRGRPPGSKNKDKVKVELSAYLVFVKDLVVKVLSLTSPLLKLKYFVCDGAYGSNDVVQLAQQAGLSLISKLKSNSALYFPYKGKQKAKGAKRIYGDKLDYQHIPGKHLQRSTITKNIQTDIYQLNLRHKNFPQLLNIVIIVKTNLKTKARAHVVLFSSDLSLSYDKLIDYYALRFQIEFNFRDAKQFWGLEDFMSIKERPIHNAANLSLFMVTVSKVLLQPQKTINPDFSVLDLKAHARAYRYAFEALKLLPLKPKPFLIDHVLNNFPKLGAIRRL